MTICLYQDTRHKDSLLWIRQVFGIGYLSDRNDHMTELRVNGFKEVEKILTLLQPFIKFKQQQVILMLRILSRLRGKRIVELSREERLAIADDIISLRKENYQSHQRAYTDESVKAILGF